VVVKVLEVAVKVVEKVV
jgi:hypothetical protein